MKCLAAFGAGEMYAVFAVLGVDVLVIHFTAAFKRRTAYQALAFKLIQVSVDRAHTDAAVGKGIRYLFDRKKSIVIRFQKIRQHFSLSR